MGLNGTNIEKSPFFEKLVGGDWNMNFIFPYKEGMVIQSDVHIFGMG